MEINEKYVKLQEKYKLPYFDDLEKTFDVSCIEHDKFLLKEIRRKIGEKLEHFTKILEGIISPDTNFTGMYEYKSFNDDEKKQIMDLYRKIMFFYRGCMELDVCYEEAQEAEFIKNIWKQWNNIEKDMKKLFKKLKDSWQREDTTKEDLGYLG